MSFLTLARGSAASCVARETRTVLLSSWPLPFKSDTINPRPPSPHVSCYRNLS